MPLTAAFYLQGHGRHRCHGAAVESSDREVQHHRTVSQVGSVHHCAAFRRLLPLCGHWSLTFFDRLNIRSVINMQLPGEHAHCGPSLDPESGFTYTPQIFMDNDSKMSLFNQNRTCNQFWKGQYHIKCWCVCIFVYFQYIFTTLGCQIMECRPSWASLTE